MLVAELTVLLLSLCVGKVCRWLNGLHLVEIQTSFQVLHLGATRGGQAAALRLVRELGGEWRSMVLAVGVDEWVRLGGTSTLRCSLAAVAFTARSDDLATTH